MLLTRSAKGTSLRDNCVNNINNIKYRNEEEIVSLEIKVFLP